MLCLFFCEGLSRGSWLKLFKLVFDGAGFLRLDILRSTQRLFDISSMSTVLAFSFKGIVCQSVSSHVFSKLLSVVLVFLVN